MERGAAEKDPQDQCLRGFPLRQEGRLRGPAVTTSTLFFAAPAADNLLQLLQQLHRETLCTPRTFSDMSGEEHTTRAIVLMIMNLVV